MSEQRYILPSGRVVRLQIPDLWAIVSQAGKIPNPIVMAVLDLLVQEDAYTGGGSGPDPRIYLRKRESVLGMYAIAALCLVEPKLALGRPAQEGEITPSQLPFADLEVIYLGWFRRGAALPAGPVPDAADPERAPGAAPGGGDVPPPAE